MSKRKTYGVMGMMEWVAVIKCGLAEVKVHFSGGSLSGYGVVPAQYTTEDPFIQTVIERSKYFESGKITLLRETQGTGKYKNVIKERHADAGTHMPGQAATTSVVMETSLNPDGAPKKVEDGGKNATEGDNKGADAADAAEGVVTPAEQTLFPEEGQNAGAGLVGDGSGIVVEVNDLDDAKAYLVDEFEGVTMSSLRSKVAVLRCAAEHNIVFKGLEE